MLRPAVSGGYGTWTHGFNVLSHWWKMFVGQKSSCVGHRAGNKPCQTTVSGADSSVVMGREGRAFPVPSILPKQTSRGLTFQVHHLQSWPGGSLPRNIGTWIFLWVSREKVAGEALVSRGISLEVITDIFKLYLFIYLFIYLFLPVQGLHCSTWAFSSCGKQGLFSVLFRCRLLIVVALLAAEHWL